MTPGDPNSGNAPHSGNTPPSDWRQVRDQRRMQHMQWRMQKAQQRAEWHRQHPGGGHLAGGLVLLIIGVWFLLNNLGVFYVEDVRKYWPVLLIVAGVAHLFSSRHGVRSLVWGGLLASIGGLLLARNLGYIHMDVWQIIWPVILIFLGLLFLFRARRGGGGFIGPPSCGGGVASGAGSGPANPNVLDEVTVFGGIQRRIDSQDFEGGDLSSVFGGIEVDLRGANTKKDEIVIEANAVFGGIDLMLPDRWSVTVRGSGIFGGYDDQTHPPANPAEKRPHLTVTGSAVFGGVTVRN
jgi:hypothetical protein